MPLPALLAGTSWATLFTCLQAALAAAARGETAPAAVALAMPVLCAALLLRAVAAAQGQATMWGALQPAAAAYQREALPLKQLAASLSRRWVLLLLHQRRQLARRSVPIRLSIDRRRI